MQNKSILQLGILVLCLHGSVAYAASNASLWGNIDQPVAPVQQVEQQQQEAQEKLIQIQNEKTICELFTMQPTLDSDQANAGKIRDALKRAYQSAGPDYKMLLVSSSAANDLYSKYRELYIKTYCTGKQQ
jgi:hypothetical protein